MPSFNRKKGYVDSLTRKHKHGDAKSTKYANEEGECSKATSSVEKDDTSFEKQFEGTVVNELAFLIFFRVFSNSFMTNTFLSLFL
jgi:hypothetical protein